MAYIQWDPSLETGDELVDAHHQTIHQLFNDLDAEATGDVEVMRVLTFLNEYVLMHFATEEALMLRVRYPFVEEHRLEHRKLTEGVRDLVLAFRTGKLAGAGGIADFLRPWLANHIHQQDRKLVDHCRPMGAAAMLPEPWASSGGPAKTP